MSRNSDCLGKWNQNCISRKLQIAISSEESTWKNSWKRNFYTFRFHLSFVFFHFDSTFFFVSWCLMTFSLVQNIKWNVVLYCTEEIFWQRRVATYWEKSTFKVLAFKQAWTLNSNTAGKHETHPSPKTILFLILDYLNQLCEFN